jgi:hypothetical protein
MKPFTPKPKHCEMCGTLFSPRASFATCCGPSCAIRKGKADKAAAKVKLKERKAALETIPELIKIAQRSFNAYIRERDKDKPCICCGRTTNDKDLLTGSRWDAGHYRSTGSASHLRFNEDNCHRQLVYCNRHGAGRAVDYRIGLVARIGLPAVEALESNNVPHKWERDELRAIAATYRAKLKALLQEKETA